MAAPQGDAHFLAVELQHLNVDLFARPHHVRWIGHAAPGQIGDVQQPVDAAQIDKDSVAGDALHRAVKDLALGQRIDQLLPLRQLFVFENRAAADHDVAALAIELQHANFKFAALPLIQFVHRPEIGLRCGKECPNADVHHQAALDAVHHLPGHIGLVAVGLVEVGPDATAVGALVGKHDVAFFVLAGELDFNGLAGQKLRRIASLDELLRGNQSLGLAADIHDDAEIGHRDHAAFDNFSFGRSLLRRRILIHELIEFFVGRQAAFRFGGRSSIGSETASGAAALSEVVVGPLSAEGWCSAGG